MTIPLLLILHVYYPDEIKTRVMVCSGHVARAHVNKLKKMAGILKFTNVDTVECCCSGGKHKKRCGCLSDRDIIISSAALLIQIKIQIALKRNYVN